MPLIERGPNKPKEDLEEVLTEFKKTLNETLRAGMDTHEFQDAMFAINAELDDISVAVRGLRVKAKEKE